MKKTILSALFFAICLLNARADNTFCNPLNIDYRFSIESGASYREAADPTVVLFQDDYYLFASKSGGYWWSSDFKNWTFVTPTGLDIEKYAPSVWVIGNVMYYTSSSDGDIYKTTDPKGGVWEYVSHPSNWADPWVFVDDNGRVYAYYGSASDGAIKGIELDPNNKFAKIGNVVDLIYSNSENNGFEVHGDNNETGLPWTEGASLLKHNNKYYLLYATPGTEKRSYCDAYYVSDSPLGPFTLGQNSPVIRKSLGYVTGTGHGGIFRDKAGKLWAIETLVISNKAFFERRLALFPVGIDENGLLYGNTIFGDYPQYYPGIASDPVTDNSPEWNLLSKGKAVTVSSTHGSNEAAFAVDENIKTCWSATTGNVGEWLSVDLRKTCTVNGIQANFYESETTYASGRETAFTTKYIVEYSTDNTNWNVLIDKSQSTKDTPHDYTELAVPVSARYLKITNKGDVPGYGYFAVTDFRIFGTDNSNPPAAVEVVSGKRLLLDQKCATINWEAVAGADGYIIRYGIAPDKLWNHYQVWSGTSYPVRSLITEQTYYFRVDAYNGSGITEGTVTIEVPTRTDSFTYFPLTNNDFNPSIWTDGTFDETTKTLITGQYGFGGWLYPNGLDLSEWKYLVVKLAQTQNCGASFRLYDENNYWTDCAFNDIGNNRTIAVELNNMRKGENKDKGVCNPSHLYIIGFWSFGGSPIQFDNVYVTNNDNLDPPSAIHSVFADDEPAEVDVYSISGIKIRSQVKCESATQGLPNGVYIAGKNKVIVTNQSK
jgi:hypothetical protein